MNRNSYTYFLGRITKGGALTTEDLIKAILKPKVIVKYEYAYTFTEMLFNDKEKWIFGKLTKFKPEGEIETVDLSSHKESSVQIPHTIESSSPFIVDLKFMGIAYPNVWNQLKKEQFEKYFCELIEDKYDKLLVKCEIEPIVDLRTFVERVSSLDKINKIKAKVVPPNPLFGPEWKELKDYLEMRNSDELSIRESSSNESGLVTQLISLMRKYVGNKQDNTQEQENKKSQNIGVTDKAVLMTADGYGHSTIEGKKEGKDIIIKTKENQKSFTYLKAADPEELAAITRDLLEKINKERYLEH